MSKTASEIIVTDSPFNMAAIRQSVRNVSCIALPYGMSSLSQHLLPFFEQFGHIIFWFGEELAGWEAMKMFAKKLSVNRCSFIRCISQLIIYFSEIHWLSRKSRKSNICRPKNDQPAATVALSKGLDVAKILKNCESLKHNYITSFQVLRDDVYRELSNADIVSGVKVRKCSLI